MAVKSYRFEENVNYIIQWMFILAMIPYYDENDNSGTEVIYFDGRRERYPVSCEQVLEDVANHLHTTLALLRNLIKKRISDGRWGELRKVPYGLSRHCIFFPVKIRSEKKRNSGALGYVLYKQIETVEVISRGRCRILFKNGIEPLEVNQDYDGVSYQMELSAELEKLLTIKAECMTDACGNAGEVMSGEISLVQAQKQKQNS